jgi:mono/diheme cytochrome c family protein
MGRGLIAAIAAGVLVMFSLPAPQQGLQNAFQSMVNWVYPPIRDMRRGVHLPPQKFANPGPPELSVPVTGRERPMDRDLAAQRLSNPVAATPASVAQGDTLFQRLCSPCHGATLAGNGPVAAAFMPPPDLLGQQVRDRKDGYLYSYIRNGGVIMPSYGFQLSAEETWHVINFIRHLQRTSPR